MKAIVTGSSGFVGNYLLRRNPESVGIDFKKSSLTEVLLDLNDTKVSSLELDSYNILVHLAGVQYQDKTPWWNRRKVFNSNLKMASNIANFANTNNISRLIYVSTDMVYGNAKIKPVKETCVANPIGPYGHSKLNAEKILSEKFQGELVILRPRLIMGPGRSGTVALFHKFMTDFKVVPVLGNGETAYQFISVVDLCRAIELASNHDFTAGVYNIGSHNPPTLNNLIYDTATSLGKKIRVLHLPARPIKYFLSFLDFLNLSPLVPEQFKIADADIILDTQKLEAQGWKPNFGDLEIFIEAMKFLDGNSEGEDFF